MRKPRLIRAIFLFAVASFMVISAGLVLFAYSDGWFDPSQYGFSVDENVTHDLKPVVLFDDGRPDYASMLNHECKDRVPSSENAAIDFINLIGPLGYPDDSIQQLERLLDTELFTQPSPPYLPWKWIPASDPGRILDVTLPWDQGKYPACAELLEKNQDLLDQISNQSNKPSFFLPLLSNPNQPLVFLDIEYESQIADISKQLSARASLAIHQSNYVQAVSDLKALARIARHLQQPPQTLVRCTIAKSVSGLSSRLTSAFAIEIAKQSNESNRTYLDELSRTCREEWWTDSFQLDVERGERFVALDSAMNIALYGADSENGHRRTIDQRMFNSVNWNSVLADINLFFDQLHEIGSREEYRDVPPSLEKLRAQFLRRSGNPMSYLQAMVSRRARAKRLREIMTGNLSLSASLADLRFFHQTQVRFAFTSILLSEYHCIHGGYPESLNNIDASRAPTSIIDPFSGQPFRYTCEEGGQSYRLYSIGPNLRDDRGLAFGAIGVDDIPAFHPGPNGPIDASVPQR